MDIVYSLLIIAAVALFVFFLFKIITKPLKLTFKFLVNTLLGFIILLVVNYIGGFIGFVIDISLLSCFITGLLGVPGVIILIILQLLF